MLLKKLMKTKNNMKGLMIKRIILTSMVLFTIYVIGCKQPNTSAPSVEDNSLDTVQIDSLKSISDTIQIK